VKTLFNILAFIAFVAGIFAAWYGYAALSIWLALFGIGGLLAGIADDLAGIKVFAEMEYENRTVQILKPDLSSIGPIMADPLPPTPAALCVTEDDHVWLLGEAIDCSNKRCAICGATRRIES